MFSRGESSMDTSRTPGFPREVHVANRAQKSAAGMARQNRRVVRMVIARGVLQPWRSINSAISLCYYSGVANPVVQGWLLGIESGHNMADPP